MTEAILEVQDLATWFYTGRGIVKAVNGVSFSLTEGECLCLVGESGCGKSVTALSLLRLFDSPPGRIVDGRVMYEGVDLTKCSTGHLRQVRGKSISMIFQNAQSALNPVFTIGDQIMEQINTHGRVVQADAVSQACKLLEEMSIPAPERTLKMYPHQMSGGMKQRAMIAMSLSCAPRILIADEPTTAVDVTIRAQIMNILRELKASRNMAVLFITHDLSLVREIGDRVAVIYGGRVVESGTVDDILRSPQHPYTRGLISCLPDIADDLVRLPSIPGTTPNPLDMPPACPFEPRCGLSVEGCRQSVPGMTDIAGGHCIACHMYTAERGH